MARSMEDVIKRMIGHNDSKKGLIIGIDGLGGAGKTTYARSLKARLEMRDMHVVLLHMDDFIHPKRIRYNREKAEWFCYYNIQWRYDYMIESIFTPLQSGRSIHQTIECYDKVNDSYRNQRIHITKDTVLMIEGVFIQRPLLRPYFDFVLFLDVPKEKRLQRVLHRDTYIGNRSDIKEKYERRYFPAEEKYVAECSPHSKADYVVKHE